jgi:cytochrome d ubiquinol oxidase subunit I
MAMEGHFRSYPNGAPLILFGIPNDAEQRIDHTIEIPRLSSLILKHDLDAPLAGLDTIAPEDRPPVELVFWTFRVMVALGFLMLLLGACSLVARLAGKLYDWRWLLRFAAVMGPSGFVAVIAGWITTEVGRQPFTIYGVLRTAESASPLAAPAVAASLIAFVIVYFAVFGMGTWYLLKLMSHAPQPHEPDPPNAPAHAAGITPGPALAAAGAAPEPSHD